MTKNDAERAQAAWYERYFIWVVIAGAAIAMALSLGIGLMQSIWFDEAYSITLAKQPLAELIKLTAVDTHPPLYYILLKAWAGLFGWGDVALRSMSVLAMGGTIVIGALLARRLFGMRAALTTLPFMVLAPFLLRYGFEIRMYALAGLVCMAATCVLVCAVERRKWWLWLAYGLLIAIGVHMLYYSVVIWAAHAVWLLYSARQDKTLWRAQWWLAYGAALALFTPWLLVFLKQLGNGALAPIAQQLTLDNMAGIVSFWFVYRPAWQLDGWLSLVIVAVMVAMVWLAMRASVKLPAKQRPYIALLLCYVGVPIAMVALLSLVRPMYVERYLAHVLPGFGLLLGVAVWLAMRQTQRAKLVGVGLAAAMLLGVVQLASVGNYNFQRLHRPQVAEAASAIVCTKDSPVVAADPYVAIELGVYLPDCPIRFYSETAQLSGGYAPLSNSPLRLADPAHDLAGFAHVTYVYYDQPKLQLPPQLAEAQRQAFGPLSVATFTAE